MKAKKPIGIIGFGNMGRAIASNLKGHYPLVIFDKESFALGHCNKKNKAKNLKDLLLRAETIILAVKPQDFERLLKEIKTSKNKLLISIAAGITTTYIEKFLSKARVIRAMPNMPARVAKGMTCLCKGKYACAGDMRAARNIFIHLGRVQVLKEKMMNAATAVSGSGPGYFYDYLDSLSIASGNISRSLVNNFRCAFRKAAQAAGFKKNQACLLVNTTIRGSIAAAQAFDLTWAQLRQQVVSKGGTTEAALEVLHRKGSLVEAVMAAKKRAGQLEKKR
ncbi:MAG: pyrroline-5-carboxylate reductase [Candidatus Omnitrophica bacterium]|nr:pyrroline-5-carboxylate reductase [Candidatus Omnitrophota bacterium]MDD5429244.1 pyrroline-5-carboxylate reductase [Candidatus Omnitrophota bacterium]